MPISAPETLLVLFLTVVFLGLLVELSRCDHCPVSQAATRRGPRPLAPHA